MIIHNYNIIERIAESPQATVYKAYHKENPQQLLVLKVLNENYLSPYKKTQITQKIEQLRVLNDPEVITPINFNSKDGTCYIIQNYFHGTSLNRIMAENDRISLKDFFTMSIGLARVLDKVHDTGIIHGGIKPHNILVDDKLNIRLIDFITAIDVRDVSHFIYERSFIRETLAYTSPEQTGRINHQVSFSSDLYSLGIVFYEMLTGELPFSSQDPLELIQISPSHSARSFQN